MTEIQQWDYLRPEIRSFALAMENQLRANDWKGGWQNIGVSGCLERLKEETEELENECYESFVTPAKVLKEAADVANFAMFTCDLAGGFD